VRQLNSGNGDQLESVVIYPGEYFASNRSVRISTLLGSCVAACLFDPVNRVLGMNHFLLSSEMYRRHPATFATPSGRYGVQAMELLINRMMGLGAVRKHLKAKAFGGATLKGFNRYPDDRKSIGNANIAFIREFLALEKIELVAEDLGGDRGRTIYFLSTDFSVYVRKHEPVRLSELIATESAYEKHIRLREQTEKGDVSLWQ